MKKILFHSILVCTSILSINVHGDDDPGKRRGSTFGIHLPGLRDSYTLGSLQSIEIEVSRLNEKTAEGKERFYLSLSGGHDFYSEPSELREFYNSSEDREKRKADHWERKLKGFRLNPGIDASWRKDDESNERLDIALDAVSAYGVFKTVTNVTGATDRVRLTLGDLGYLYSEDHDFGIKKNGGTVDIFRVNYEKAFTFGVLPLNVGIDASIGTFFGDIKVEDWKETSGEEKSGFVNPWKLRTCVVLGGDAGPAGNINAKYTFKIEAPLQNDQYTAVDQSFEIGVDEIGGRNFPVNIGLHYECDIDHFAHTTTVEDPTSLTRDGDVPTRTNIRLTSTRVENKIKLSVGF